VAFKYTSGYSTRWGNYPVAEGLIYSRVGKHSRELGINKLRVHFITTVTLGSNQSNVLEKSGASPNWLYTWSNMYLYV